MRGCGQESTALFSLQERALGHKGNPQYGKHIKCADSLAYSCWPWKQERQVSAMGP